MKYATTNQPFLDYLKTQELLKGFSFISSFEARITKKLAILVPPEIVTSDYITSTMYIRIPITQRDLECKISDFKKVLKGLNDNLLVDYDKYRINFSYDESDFLYNSTEDSVYIYSLLYQLKIIEREEQNEREVING